MQPDYNKNNITSTSRRRILRTGAVVSAATIAGCASLPGDDQSTELPPEPPADSWPMFSYDRRNSGHNTAATGPKDAVEPRWKFESGGAVRSSPAVVRETVYVGSDDGHVYAIDATSGDKLWTYQTDGPVVSSPAVLRNTVYVGSEDGHIYALNAETGDHAWDIETGERVHSSPTVEADAKGRGYDDVVAIGSDDGSLYILDAGTGDQLKTLRTDGPVVSAPAILTTSAGYWEVGAGSTDGKTHWWVPDYQEGESNRKDIGAPVHAAVSVSPIAHEDVWYTASDDGTLIRSQLPPHNVWTFEAGDKIRTTPVLAGEAVYVGSWDANVYAVDVESGDQNWAFETGGKVNSSAVADGVLYVGSADGRVYGLDAETGESLWAFETGREVRSSPAVVDGTVYVGSDDRTIYALAESTD